MPTITIPGHGDVEFPDSMNDADVLAAVRKLSPPTAPAAAPGKAEALARGAGQGATLGFGDELGAAVGAGLQKALPDSMGGITYGKPFAQLYRENRDVFRKENEAAKTAHPWIYGAGQIAGGAPLAIASGGVGGAGAKGIIGTGAAFGGASGLGESTAEDLSGMLKDTGKGAALGAALAGGVVGAGKAIPYLRTALSNLAASSGRRALRNVGGSIAASVPLADDAVREAINSGAIRFGGTTEGAASRLEQLRQALGGQKAKLMDALAAKGITGPAADAMAQKFATEGTQAASTTMNPSVPRVYESAAEMVGGKAPAGGNLSVAQAEELKGSLQDMARASYRQLDPNEVGQAREAAAAVMRKSVEEEIAKQAQGAAPDVQDLASQFSPLKERLSNVIAAHEVAKVGAARGANRSALSLPDIGAFLAGSTHGGPLTGTGAAVASHLARTRGPSSVAAAAQGGANILDYLTGPITSTAQARTQALIQALRNRALPLAAAEAGGETR